MGAVYVYSDLSFITLQFIVGGLARDLGYVTPSDFLPMCTQFNSSEGVWGVLVRVLALCYRVPVVDVGHAARAPLVPHPPFSHPLPLLRNTRFADLIHCVVVCDQGCRGRVTTRRTSASTCSACWVCRKLVRTCIRQAPLGTPWT